MYGFLQINTGDEGDESESCDSESSETLDLSKITQMRLVPSEGDGLEWDDSQIPFTIGYEIGDHDLASSVLKFKVNDIILMRDTGFVKDHRDEREMAWSGMTRKFLSQLVMQMEITEMTAVSRR